MEACRCLLAETRAAVRCEQNTASPVGRSNLTREPLLPGNSHKGVLVGGQITYITSHPTQCKTSKGSLGMQVPQVDGIRIARIEPHLSDIQNLPEMADHNQTQRPAKTSKWYSWNIS